MRCAEVVRAISDPFFAMIAEPATINCRSAEQGLANSPETPDFNPVAAPFADCRLEVRAALN